MIKKFVDSILGHVCAWKSILAKIWPRSWWQKHSKSLKFDEFCVWQKQSRRPKIKTWPRAKGTRKMFPWPTNMFGPMGKSITGIKIVPWPRFGQIFGHSTFSKLPKILWKWRISMGYQLESNSYQKALAKGQQRLGNESFWPTNVSLANACQQTECRSFSAKIWPLLLPKTSPKIKKYDEIHVYGYWTQVHREVVDQR